ncbi:hypothetical protein [Streptomyces calvus]
MGHSQGNVTSSVPGFAAALAERLPGRWQAGPPVNLAAQDAGNHRIWHSGPLAYTAFNATNLHRYVLTSPHGLQLYVLPRPRRSDQFLVLPMLPAGCDKQHVRGLTSPRGIAVPAEPVRAAAAVRRRMLLEYRFASMPARRAAITQRLQVQVTFDARHRPRIRTTYLRALHLLLGQGGFLLDPATGECHLPDTFTAKQASRQLYRSLERLRHLGFSVRVRSSVSPHSPSHPSAPRANPPKGPSR